MVGAVERAVGQADAGGAPSFDHDFGHRSIVVEATVEFFDQPHQRPHQHPRAAHDVVDAPLPFQIVDHGVDG